MKIAIISDTHDNLANLKKALLLIEKEKVKMLFHCGDIFSSKTLDKIFNSFSGKIFVVLSEPDQNYIKNPEKLFGKKKRIKIWKDSGEIKIGNKKIAVTHTPELAESLAFQKGYHLIFYGHTHKPWEEKIGETRLINPGNIAGIFYRPTLAIFDTKKETIELKII